MAESCVAPDRSSIAKKHGRIGPVALLGLVCVFVDLLGDEVKWHGFVADWITFAGTVVLFVGWFGDARTLRASTDQAVGLF